MFNVQPKLGGVERLLPLLLIKSGCTWTHLGNLLTIPQRTDSALKTTAYIYKYLNPNPNSFNTSTHTSRNRNNSLIPPKGADPLEIHQLFSTVGSKISQLFVSNQVLENILDLKLAIILIAVSLIISSLALLILVLSHHRLKKSLMLLKSNFSPTLPK